MAAYAEVAARTNFSLLDGASHPAELVTTAAALRQAGIGIADTNSLAGVMRAHVAAREVGICLVVGARLVLRDGAEYLAWPTDRAAYGRLTRLLSLGRTDASKGGCHITREQMLEHAPGWVLAAVPGRAEDLGARLRADAAALRGRLALPLLVAATCTARGHGRHRLDTLARAADAAGAELLATNDVRCHDPGRRPLADVLTAIRLGTTVDALGYAAEPNAERCLKPPAEMVRLFEAHPQALANTLRVLEAASGFVLDQLRHEYPDEILEPGRTPQETLVLRVAAAIRERWPEGAPDDLRRRLRHELGLIAELGSCISRPRSDLSSQRPCPWHPAVPIAGCPRHPWRCPHWRSGPLRSGAPAGQGSTAAPSPQSVRRTAPSSRPPPPRPRRSHSLRG
ncbi:PHP domain-containing protein [Roseicella aerolata]|uniref:PHP domain-containing protein n=1 Tax=Roseicella aerolata TaxID=2883479 RepID=A0A9X1LAU1_9PROT|nr:PHP domain-containing protein [Roseicella aerolata]